MICTYVELIHATQQKFNILIIRTMWSVNDTPGQVQFYYDVSD